MKTGEMKRAAYWALLGLEIGAPVLFLVLWGRWPYAVLYLMLIYVGRALVGAKKYVEAHPEVYLREMGYYSPDWRDRSTTPRFWRPPRK